jgi:hypothetical protein
MLTGTFLLFKYYNPLKPVALLLTLHIATFGYSINTAKKISAINKSGEY